MTTVRCRPIDRWDGPRRPDGERRVAPYGASWARTRRDLEHEIRHLDGTDVTVGIDVRPDQIRVDGWPKGNVSVPAAVVLTFESSQGPLRFQCDRWAHWEDNLRAIGLTLQRLRLVDEGGVARSGEQYRGWGALPPGQPMPPAAMSVDDAVIFIGTWAWDHPYVNPHEVIDDLDAAYRAAAKRLHPDTGGDPALFRRLSEARDLLRSHR